MNNHSFTSESVSPGHPDKVCDRISDAILDALLTQDPNARVACETLVKNNWVVLAGEVSANAEVDYEAIARRVILDIGYMDDELGFNGNTCDIKVAISEQSPEIAQGVDREQAAAQGAGDQGMMFGYACKETEQLMPLPIMLAHQLMQQQTSMLKHGTLPWLRPDAKSQVSVRYEQQQPVGIDAIVLSTQHAPSVSLNEVREGVMEHILKPVLPTDWLAACPKEQIHINPTGQFVIGGPVGDCGLTGRKITVDTYGGRAPHGGGAFSGKDPSKVDRSGAYAARFVAKNLVAAGLCEQVELQVSYAIGVAQPTSLFVNTFGTGTISDEALLTLVRDHFDLTPSGIIRALDLKRPIYEPTTHFGHFGRDDLYLSWEQVTLAEALSAAA